MKPRSGGLLLHPSSLPAPFGVGDLGPEAFAFVDFLHSSSQRFWQILPLTPVSPASGYSPYNSLSAFAGNTLLISPELLVRDGLLQEQDILGYPGCNSDQAAYAAAFEWKQGLFDQAFAAFCRLGPDPDFERFCRKNAHWLEDYVLFLALKKEFGPEKTWNDWPEAYRSRRKEDLAGAAGDLREDLDRERFLQYMFYRQWMALKAYCRRKQVQLIGDLPIYPAYDSVDVWVRPELFKLEPDGMPRSVSGVPPDYFSETGQLWGNPVYDWAAHQKTGFAWWIDRLAHNLECLDMLRIDHFRGFVAAWEVPYGDRTALNGSWAEAPAREFFRTLQHSFPCLPIIAEDLGEITSDVREVISLFDIPGMKVLLFAFGDQEGSNPFLPHLYPENCLAYTGTHDTNTVMGWWDRETTPEIRNEVFAYLGREVPEEELPWELIRLGMMSVARLMVVPVQDLLCLPAAARMNNPASGVGNWGWRLVPGQLDSGLARKLAAMTKIYGRG